MRRRSEREHQADVEHRIAEGAGDHRVTLRGNGAGVPVDAVQGLRADQRVAAEDLERAPAVTHAHIELPSIVVEQGRLVPDAAVAAAAKGVVYAAVVPVTLSDGRGKFTIPNLPPGDYRITGDLIATSGGWRLAASLQPVTVEAGSEIRLNDPLKLK